MISRVYLRIYLTLLGALLASALIVALAWRHSFEGRFMGVDFTALMQEIVIELVPPPNATRAQLEAALARWHRLTRANLALYDAQRSVLALAGPAPPDLPARADESGWIHSGRGPGALALHLPDGRWLVASHNHGARRYSFLMTLMVIAVVLGIVAYPVARRLTRRLEALKIMAQSLGAGNLAARAQVDGKDEIASLGHSLNQSADRIQALVQAQKNLLANASHELRSPLTRLRLMLEDNETNTQPNTRADIRREIDELDQLIEEILLASRIETMPPSSERFEEVDLAGLLAEECARVGAEISASHAIVRGDPLLLRRMLRNLLENAQRHGAGSDIEASLAHAQSDTCTLHICDRGPGIPTHEREKIFQPFYRIDGRRSSGTGLGLALVRQIAQLHSGDVNCEARAGGGSCFVVRLPAG